MDRRRKLEAAARAQERWRRRELSTFDYIMVGAIFWGAYQLVKR